MDTKLPDRKPIPDMEQGLYRKFKVERVDGSHESCDYFVLDVDHDPHAKVALRAYAESVKHTHPILADEMKICYKL